jgi:hypothetical protein
MSFDLSNYVDVPTRLKELIERYPNASVVADPPCVREIDGRSFIEVTVTIHCNDEHNRMARASAWESFPGKTPYTKDSEMMNAETSATGRACGLLGIGLKSSVASLDEVRTRRQESQALHPSTDTPAQSSDEASPKQKAMIRGLTRQKGQPAINPDGLTKREASAHIERLMAMNDVHD